MKFSLHPGMCFKIKHQRKLVVDFIMCRKKKLEVSRSGANEIPQALA